MITPSFALTATERVLPRLALDFTTAALDPRVTVTRALNTATVTNANGSISIVNANLPRFDYANGICKGLLIEEARTNLLINSVWAGAVTGTPGTPPTSWINAQTAGSISAIAPATYAAGNALTFTCSSQRRVIYQRPSVAANTSYTASFDIVTTTSDVQLYSVVEFRNMPVGAAITGYTLNGATATSATAMPIGTHKVTITASISAISGTLDVFIGLGIQNNITSAVTISNIQFEAGAFATSYIPTTTLAVTRNADVVSMTGTNFSDWYNASEGAFAANATTLSPLGSTQRIFSASTGSFADAISASASGVDLYCQCFTAGGLEANMFFAGGANNTSFRLSYAYKVNNAAAALKAGTVATDTSITLPAPNQFGIGNEGGGAIFNGWISSIRFWPQRLTNAEVQAFSK